MTRFLNLPGAPILLPRVAGSGDPAARLRSVAQQAIRTILPDHGRVIVLAGGSATRSWDAATGYDLGRLIGRARADQDQPSTPAYAESGEISLPLPLAVARGLLNVDLDRLQLITVAAGADLDRMTTELLGTELDRDDLVVTIADGSALGKPGGPDVVHPQAAEFDRALTVAWRSGAPARLAELDTELATAVLSNGSVVWRWIAEVADRQPHGVPYDSKITFADSPFGVFYLIASWT